MAAVVALIGAGDPSPNSRRIARQAGVSVRLVFHHFGDLDALFVGAADDQVARYRSLITIIPARGPVETRIRIICRQRRRLFEAVGPVLRASSARSPATAARSQVLADQRVLLRRQIAVTLAPEIDARGPLAAVVLDTIDVAAGWQNWNPLRLDAGHTASSAEQVVAFAVSRLLR
ncbi:MAG TPA: TetR/AcrR family transcriptional regulator [Acidimicrobiales bacterium]|jgi:AcrR family transcriptional regulator|nr:TetR/AcrR family transcriptional regulator [Acidimicrobiales bacterium]